LAHFFLYPVGHFGLTAVTFLVALPFTQVIVDFFAMAIGEADALGAGVGLAFWTS
jgi:hypothetical protein